MSNPECPRCGYSRARADLHSPSTINEQEEDLSALQAELRRIEDSISSPEKYLSRLIEAKCIVSRKVNTIQAATRHLPPEVLSIIFQLARPSIDFDAHYLNLEKSRNLFHSGERVLYVLTAVSHHWRQVALATQQLWTTVRLEINAYSAYSTVHGKVSLLDLHFQNARNAPLSIELDFADLPFMDRDYLETVPDFEMHYEEASDTREDLLKYLEPLQTVVFGDKAPMIRHLFLIRPPADWLPLFNENLSQCNSVTVFQPQPRMSEREDDEPYDDILDLTRLPCLQRVQLIDYFLDVLIPESIKTLHLRDMFPSLCVRLLSRCRNIVNFEVVRFTLELEEVPQLKEPVTFPNLEHFRWSNANLVIDNGPIPELLPRILLPALRSLVWADDEDTFAEQPSSEDPRCCFFAHLPPSLFSLTLIKTSYNPQNHTIPRLLIHVPQVSELHLVECPVMTIEIAAKVIGQRQHCSRTVLPNLRKLTITSSILAIEDINLQEIVGMLEALHATKSGEKRDRFHLHINLVTKVWNDDEHVLGRLRALVKDGFDLEVCIRSHVLDLGN